MRPVSMRYASPYLRCSRVVRKAVSSDVPKPTMVGSHFAEVSAAVSLDSNLIVRSKGLRLFDDLRVKRAVPGLRGRDFVPVRHKRLRPFPG